MPVLRQQRGWNGPDRLQQGYLDALMTQYAREVISEHRARARARQINRNTQPDITRINFILTPQSIVITLTEDHFQNILAGCIVAILMVALVKLIRFIGIYLMRSEAAYKAAEILFFGRICLLLMCELLRMWCWQEGDLRSRLEVSAYVLGAGLSVWLWAKWDGVPMF